MADKRPRTPGRKKAVRRTQRSGIDWRKARRLHEKQHKSFTEIAEILGCDRGTVARHAKREGWVNAAELLRESSGDRREELLRSFIEQDTEAIRENLRLKHSLNRRVLGLVQGHIERLEQGLQLVIGSGERVVDEDPMLAIRRIALTIQTVEGVDRSLADLKGHDWRSGSGASASDSGADSDAVDAALAEAEAEKPSRRGQGGEGEVPD